jgi:hypothetical protein
MGLSVAKKHREAAKKSWDRLPACHFPYVSDRLEAYPTNKITASERGHTSVHALGVSWQPISRGRNRETSELARVAPDVHGGFIRS